MVYVRNQSVRELLAAAPGSYQGVQQPDCISPACVDDEQVSSLTPN